MLDIYLVDMKDYHATITKVYMTDPFCECEGRFLYRLSIVSCRKILWFYAIETDICKSSRHFSDCIYDYNWKCSVIGYIPLYVDINITEEEKRIESNE